MSVTNFSLPTTTGTTGAIDSSCGETMQGLGSLAPAVAGPAGSFGSLLDAGTPVVPTTTEALPGEAQPQAVFPLCALPVRLQTGLQPVAMADLGAETETPADPLVVLTTEQPATPESLAQDQTVVTPQAEAPASGLFTATPVASNRLVPRKPVTVSVPLPAGSAAVTVVSMTSPKGSPVQTGEPVVGETENLAETALSQDSPAAGLPSVGLMEQSAAYGVSTLQPCQIQKTPPPESLEGAEEEPGAGAPTVTMRTAREKTTGAPTSEDTKTFTGQGLAGEKSQGRLQGKAYGVVQAPGYASNLASTPSTEETAGSPAVTPAWSAGYARMAKEFSTVQPSLQNTKPVLNAEDGSTVSVTAENGEPGLAPVVQAAGQSDRGDAKRGNSGENTGNEAKGSLLGVPSSLKEKDPAKNSTLTFDATERTAAQPGAANVKVTQATDKEVTTEGVKTDGIRNAKSSGNMSINRRNNPEKASAEATQELASSFSTVRTAAGESSAPVQRTQVTEAAQRTLAIVTEVSEKMQARDSKRVDFDVKLPSDQRVSVNLEYKNGLLHVSFKTDSTALRDALSQEWTQTMVTADSAVRFAEPSFGGNSQHQQSRGETFDMSGGRQGQQQARPQQQEASRGTFSLPTSKSTATDGVSTRETPSQRRAQAPETTRILNVIA